VSLAGAGFVETYTVRWNGMGRNTAFVSSSQLSVVLTSSDLGTPGEGQWSVSSPTPGGGISNSMTFTITPVRVASVGVTTG